MRDPIADATEEAVIMLRWLADFGALHVGLRGDWVMRGRAKWEVTPENFDHLACDMRDYLCRLAAESAPPKRQDGRPTNVVRDRGIVSVIARIALHGVKPTRNPATHNTAPTSGCSIVQGVLKKRGVRMKERAIETIWRNNRHLADLEAVPLVLGLTPDTIDDAIAKQPVR
jgi:hypothetical protein